ncbi:MAG: tRNA preQ1(34) S-adenosylmethionine ribosyltransferase-isomerase QueA [Candidatus Saganbacteria bacterium]|nr:tRNA preQ1(34) S-adenosylmethionine ribosyltransferase-isomerase QueA [Candidatus Saganbacteria bacterium]
MKTSDFDYLLPEHLIAQTPAKRRDASRLMVLDVYKKTIEHKKFSNIVDYLKKGDLLVLNDTKVIPARLVGIKVGGSAKIEVVLLNKKVIGDRGWVIGGNEWECLVKPGKRLKVGSQVSFGKGALIGTVIEKKESGEQIISFKCDGKFSDVLEKIGQVPLPPYIKCQMTNDKCQINDKTQMTNRYQTVYAAREGASAAPTAGLHFTKKLLAKIRRKGVKIAYVTLHTGIATFQPVRADNIKEHKMHSEYFEIPKETLRAIKKAKRVVAVGTTTVRALESQGSRDKGQENKTDIFIYPGYKFKVVDAMITNFHFPKSTLLMMVSAFAGREFVLDAYKKAAELNYSFFSFGDAMFIK